MEVSGQLHAPAALPTELKRRPRGLQSRAGSFEEEKNVYRCRDSSSGSSSPLLGH
jgi:hypothetical protein